MTAEVVFGVTCLAASLGFLARAARTARADERADTRAAETPGGPSTAGRRPLDLMEAAFLAGGPGRVADTVLYAMRADGRLRISRDGCVRVVTPVGRTPVERALLTLCGSGGPVDSPLGGTLAGPGPGRSLRTLRTSLTLSSSVLEIGDGLSRRGLLRQAAEQDDRWHFAARLHKGVCAGVLALTLLSFASAPDPGAGPLLAAGTALLPASVLGEVLAPRHCLTREGSAALAELERHTPRAAPAGDGPRAASVLALRGTSSLPDRELRAQLAEAARPAPWRVRQPDANAPRSG